MEATMSITRRRFIDLAVSGAVATTSFAAVLALARTARAALPPQTFFAGSPGEAIRAVLGTDRSALDRAVQLKVAAIVETADMVPVSVWARLDQVESITLVADKNPDPILAHYRLAPRLAPYVATRVRLAQSSDLHALVKAGGTLHRATRYVQVSVGGCGSSDAGPETARRRGAISDHILMQAKKGDDGVLVRAIIRHPMTPPRKDPARGGPIGGLYIQEVSAQLNGKTVLSGDWGPGVARDPYLSFEIRQAAPGDVIGLSWRDNEAHHGASEVTVR
jgi:thiosulfate oxidation carrier complex protein SoxZ